MSRLLIINGSPRKDGVDAKIGQMIAERMKGYDYDAEAVNINDLNISYAAWSLCNKDESSALLKPSASADSWTEDDLSDTGIWIRNMIQGK